MWLQIIDHSPSLALYVHIHKMYYILSSSTAFVLGCLVTQLIQCVHDLVSYMQFGTNGHHNGGFVKGI